MTRDPCLKVVSLPEIQWARGGFCCEFAQCPGHSQTFPLWDCRWSNHQQEPWKGPAFSREVHVLHDPPAPVLSRHGSNRKARGHGRWEKGKGNRASDPFSAVSNLMHSISQFINVCMFTLPNLTASWKVKGLLDQQIISQALNLQVIVKKATKETQAQQTLLFSLSYKKPKNFALKLLYSFNAISSTEIFFHSLLESNTRKMKFHYPCVFHARYLWHSNSLLLIALPFWSHDNSNIQNGFLYA